MAEVMAGFVCGFGLSIIATPAAAIAIMRARVSSPLLQRIAPEGTNVLALSVVINMFLFIALTGIGIVLGLLLYAMENNSPAAGLGSPNRAFTMLIVAITAIAVLPLSVASAQFRLPLLAGGAIFLAMFGWFMPYLASWSPIEQ